MWTHWHLWKVVPKANQNCCQWSWPNYECEYVVCFSESQKQRGENNHTILQLKQKASLLLNTRHSIVAVIRRKHPWPLSKGLLRGSSKWPAQHVAVQKLQGDTCLTQRSQCEGSGVMFKSRVLLPEAEEAEVAPACSVCGSVYSFPVKAGPAQPKKRFLGRA